MKGMKHLVQCHCILPQFRKMKDPIFHQFVVFSVIDDDDAVTIKYAHCNNCGAVHKVYDLCKSEIVIGKESIKSMMTKEDIRPCLPPNIVSVLETYHCDLSTWEEVQFILEKGIQAASVVLVKDNLKDETQGKVLKLLGQSKIKIESFVRNDFVIETNDEEDIK